MRAVERRERLDHADRWLADSFRVIQLQPPGYNVILEADMGRAAELIDELRAQGQRVTYGAILLRAAAMALCRHPQLHQIMLGTTRVFPDRVNIGLSVANESFAAPVMLIEDVDRKGVLALSEELRVRVPEARRQDSETLRKMRRWGWLVPFGPLRRLILRAMFSILALRRRLTGSLAVSIVPTVDVVLPNVLSAPALLSMGRIADRVVAREGRPVVRKMVTLSITGDHKIWDGQRVGAFLSEVARILESGDFAEGIEVAHAAPLSSAQ